MAIDPAFDVSTLGLPANALPPELSGQLLENLDKIFSAQEKRQSNSLLDSQEERGLFRSGQTRDRLENEILTPSIDRRRQALLEMVQGGLQGQTQFNRQKELQNDEFMARLEEINQQFFNQKELFQLQKDLGMFGQPKKPGFGSTLASSLAGGLGSAIGNAILPGIGGLAGGLFSKAASTGVQSLWGQDGNNAQSVANIA